MQYSTVGLKANIEFSYRYLGLTWCVQNLVL